MMSKTPRTDNFKSQGREWLPLGTFEKLERENAQLRATVNAFCAEQAWASSTWKSQPHIKALFDLANK